jgi:hypothetical protein
VASQERLLADGLPTHSSNAVYGADLRADHRHPRPENPNDLAGRHPALPEQFAGRPYQVNLDRRRLVLSECRDHGVSLEGPAGAEGAHHQSRAHLPEAASDGLAKSQSPGLLRYLFVVGDTPARSAHTVSNPRQGFSHFNIFEEKNIFISMLHEFACSIQNDLASGVPSA